MQYSRKIISVGPSKVHAIATTTLNSVIEVINTQPQKIPPKRDFLT